ncbi:Maf family nucleotide pyrophosphatase [Candidatus Persebacteraceae bacterium Df01]|jgi:septum formation protein|uniref:7-methyl-GTP pyrophosphatase n=1 Tax=Candidatus Doriopsillibacter californiensis TaxID=2970740 RepID=A0ABT7QKL0_9GAMM|nr:Maf family nucleotide pyrophosphatase [Candidatus Persebacteraceae bacterium Df01]
MQHIVLASTSPYRRQLLTRLQVPFDCVSPNVDETPNIAEPPDARALRLAEEKARAAADTHPHALIIGGDQTISSGGTIFDKPGTTANAVRQLQYMSGRELHFFTAVAVFNAPRNLIQQRLISHRARFRHMSNDEIERYVQKEPALNCAGGAQIEGLGVSLLETMEGGDPTAIIGLPLMHVAAMLRNAGIAIP